MLRHFGTDAAGQPFDRATIDAVWKKAQTSEEHPPLRIDRFGSLMWREAYGNTNSKLGWEIDHLKPIAEGGTDDLANLQPLQWQNNRLKDKALAMASVTI